MTDHPELDGYVPSEGRPLRSRRTRLTMRLLVVVTLVALVLPGIATIVGFSSASAQAACAQWVAYAAPASPGSDARFELFGAGGIGWECYTAGAFGGDRHVASLGLLPGAPVLPGQNRIDS